MKNYNNQYPLGGMIIVTFLFFISIVLLYFTGLFNVASYEDFYNYICSNGVLLIFSFFFIFLSLYCWFLYIEDVIIKPKKETLYLINKATVMCTFINRKGKKFYFKDNNYELNKFYLTLKTRNNIQDVIGLSLESFEIPKEKESYWLNFYSPFGNFENIFLLPIVYVILLPGLLSFLLSEGAQKIIGIIYCAYPLYVIIYDFIYKQKKKKLINPKEKIDTKKLQQLHDTLIVIIQFGSLFFVDALLFIAVLNCSENIGRLFASIFLSLAICSSGYSISSFLKNIKAMRLFEKIYIIIFLLCLFGFLIFIIIIAFNEKSYLLFLFTIPFWIAGIYKVYKEFIKKR